MADLKAFYYEMDISVYALIYAETEEEAEKEINEGPGVQVAGNKAIKPLILNYRRVDPEEI